MVFYSQFDAVAFDFVLIKTIWRGAMTTTNSTIHFYNLDNLLICFLIYVVLLMNVYFL